MLHVLHNHDTNEICFLRIANAPETLDAIAEYLRKDFRNDENAGCLLSACRSVCEEYNAVLLAFLMEGKIKKEELGRIACAWDFLGDDSDFPLALNELHAFEAYDKLKNRVFKDYEAFGEAEDLRQEADLDLRDNGINAKALNYLQSLPSENKYCVVDWCYYVTEYDSEGEALLGEGGRHRLAEALEEGLQRLAR